MNVDLISILTLFGGLTAVVTAIWQIAGVKEKIVQRVDRVENILTEKLNKESDRLEDLIKAFEQRFDLHQEKVTALSRQRELELNREIEQLLTKYLVNRKDIYDLQQFLQLHHGFKIRLNTPSLTGKKSE